MPPGRPANKWQGNDKGRLAAVAGIWDKNHVRCQNVSSAGFPTSTSLASVTGRFILPVSPIVNDKPAVCVALIFDGNFSNLSYGYNRFAVIRQLTRKILPTPRFDVQHLTTLNF
jgi:hypothetical protein